MVYGTFFHVSVKSIWASESGEKSQPQFFLHLVSFLFGRQLSQTSNVDGNKPKLVLKNFLSLPLLMKLLLVSSDRKRRQRRSMTHHVALLVGAMEAFRMSEPSC